MSITEVQSSLVHSQQLADTFLTVELSVFIHHLDQAPTQQYLRIYIDFEDCNDWCKLVILSAENTAAT